MRLKRVISLFWPVIHIASGGKHGVHYKFAVTRRCVFAFDGELATPLLNSMRCSEAEGAAHREARRQPARRRTGRNGVPVKRRVPYRIISDTRT